MISKKYSQHFVYDFYVIWNECYNEWSSYCGKHWLLVMVLLERYFNSWLFAFPVALFAAFTMAPIMRPLVNKIASKD